MIETLIASLLAFGLCVQTGHAAYYDPGVMERVIRVRQAGWTAGTLPAEIPDGVTCFVARPDCAEIGDVVLVFHENGGWEKCWVTDCCCEIAGDCRRMKRKGIVVEVDHNTAARWGVLGHGPEHIHVVLVRQSHAAR